MWSLFGPATTMPGTSPNAARNCSTTSGPTSKQLGPIDGPSATRMRSGRAPSSTMRATTFAATPSTVPRQPAWADPITRASGSANRSGMQSAANAPSTGPDAIGDEAVELGGLGERLADLPHGGAVDVAHDLELVRSRSRRARRAGGGSPRRSPRRRPSACRGSATRAAPSRRRRCAREIHERSPRVG